MDHRNSINNRIDQLKKNYEKNKENNIEEKESINRTRLNFVGRSSIHDRVKFIESQLEKCESNRQEKNFSKLTEKFGINNISLNKDNDNKDNSNKVSLESLKSNITTGDEEDFQTRKRRFETRKNLHTQSDPNKNQIFESNESMIDFLSQAKVICEDYEKEIALLRNKLKENTTFKNLNISIHDEKNQFFFTGSCTNYFINKLAEISKDASPDFNMLNMVYSDKIQELFIENDKLQTLIKQHEDQVEIVKNLEKTIEELKFKVKDKEVYIENMNEIYATKFTEVFNENDKIKKESEEKSKETEKLKTEIEDRNREVEVFKMNQLSEMNNLEEEKMKIEKELDDRNNEIKVLKEEFEKEKKFHLENYNQSKQQIEEFDQIKNDLEDKIKKINLVLENKIIENKALESKIHEENEKLNISRREYDDLLKEKHDNKEQFEKIVMEKDLKIHNMGSIQDERLVEAIREQVHLKDKIEELEKKMIQKEILITQLESDLENKAKILIDSDENVKQSLESKNTSLSLDLTKKDESLRILEEKVKSLEEEVEDLNKDVETQKKKVKEGNEELENLRDIIAKDQLRIKQLKEFKEKALEGKLNLSDKYLEEEITIGRKATKIQSTFNGVPNIEINKEEINNLSEKLNEEKAKNKVLCDEFRKLQENISSLKLENSKKERVIEANIKMIDELKVRLRNKIKLDEIIIQNKNKSNETPTVNSVCSNCINNANNSNSTSSDNSYQKSNTLSTDFQRNRSLTLIESKNNNSLDNGENRKEKPIINKLTNTQQVNPNKETSQLNQNDLKEIEIGLIKSDGKARITFEQFNLCKMLIVENLLLNYQISQSISLNFVVDVIIKNFNFLIHSIFPNGNKTVENGEIEKDIINKNLLNLQKVNFSVGYLSGLNNISIFHEFLEDIILKIYNQGIKSKKSDDNNSEIPKENKETSSLKKSFTNFFMGKPNGDGKKEENKCHYLSKEDFCFESIKKITAEISENNILNNLINVQRTAKPSITELFGNFVQKYEKYFDYEFLNISTTNTKYYEVVNIKLEDYLNKEIKTIFFEHLKNSNLFNKNKIQLLIDKILLNFQDGNLVNSVDRTSIYNFKDFNKEFSQFNFILRNSNQEENVQSSIIKDEISNVLGINFTEHYNTLILNLSNIEEILSKRHSIDYFNFLIKTYGYDINKIIIKGDIKKNIDLKNLHAIFLNILLYNKYINKVVINDIYLSSDNNIRENENLRRMSIYKEPINVSLQELVNFINFSTTMKFLSISNCFIGDEGCKYMCKNISNFNLVELNLTNNQLKESSGFSLAELLPKLNKLESLSISCNSIHSNGFTAICTAISQMQTLQTSNKTEQNSKGFYLKFLDLSKNSLKDTECRSIVDFLAKYDAIEELDLSNNEFDTQCANSIGIYLKICKGLKKINLSKCEFNEESSPFLIKNLEISSIETLVLDNNPIGQIGGILFANLLRVNKTLKNIFLKNCSLPGLTIPMIVKNLENSSNLVEIDMRGNSLNYLEFSTINKMIEGKKIKILIDEVNPPQNK